MMLIIMVQRTRFQPKIAENAPDYHLFRIKIYDENRIELCIINESELRISFENVRCLQLQHLLSLVWQLLLYGSQRHAHLIRCLFHGTSTNTHPFLWFTVHCSCIINMHINWIHFQFHGCFFHLLLLLFSCAYPENRHPKANVRDMSFSWANKRDTRERVKKNNLLKSAFNQWVCVHVIGSTRRPWISITPMKYESVGFYCSECSQHRSCFYH